MRCPPAGTPGDPIYVRVDAVGRRRRAARLLPAVARGRPRAGPGADAHGRGSPSARCWRCRVTALLICIVMPGSIFVWYATLFSLQALYIVYISGQGFDWPLLDAAAPLGSHAWNVPAALSGAAACLFVRKITDMRRYYPRHYVVFGWLAAVFVVLALSNFVRVPATNPFITAAGNLIFLGAAALHAGRRVPRVAARQPAGRLVPGRLGAARGHDHLDRREVHRRRGRVAAVLRLAALHGRGGDPGCARHCGPAARAARRAVGRRTAGADRPAHGRPQPPLADRAPARGLRPRARPAGSRSRSCSSTSTTSRASTTRAATSPGTPACGP